MSVELLKQVEYYNYRRIMDIMFNVYKTDDKPMKNKYVLCIDSMCLNKPQIKHKFTFRYEPQMKSKYAFLSEPQDEFKHILINSSNKEYKQENKYKQNKLKIGRQQNHKKISATSRAPNRRSTWFN
jgi:hypothetical protein